jgi:hypothetical protein
VPIDAHHPQFLRVDALLLEDAQRKRMDFVGSSPALISSKRSPA